MAIKHVMISITFAYNLKKEKNDRSPNNRFISRQSINFDFTIQLIFLFRLEYIVCSELTKKPDEQVQKQEHHYWRRGCFQGARLEN